MPTQIVTMDEQFTPNDGAPASEPVVEQPETTPPVETKPEETPAPEAKVVTIGEKQFTEEELNEIVTRGTKVQEWETKMPGFDIDKLMPDYTKKSMELAEYRKRMAPKPPSQESIEDLGLDQEQLQTFEKVAKHFGYVRQIDLVQDSVEAQKAAFIGDHPEYTPGSTENDTRWNKLMERFSLYNWQAHPHKVRELLDEAHSKVASSWEEPNRGGKMKQDIIKKTAQANLNALGGGGGTGSHVQPKVVDAAMAQRYKTMGWTDEQIKEVFS